VKPNSQEFDLVGSVFRKLKQQDPTLHDELMARLMAHPQDADDLRRRRELHRSAGCCPDVP